METNNAPFYVGQRVVCLVDGRKGLLKKGDVVVIKDMRMECCGCWFMYVGQTPDYKRTMCEFHENCKFENYGKKWSHSKHFAPIQPAYESAVQEILSRFQPTDEKPDKVLKPTQVDRF